MGSFLLVCHFISRSDPLHTPPSLWRHGSCLLHAQYPCLPCPPTAAALDSKRLGAFLRKTRREYEPAFVLAAALAANVLRLELELDGVQEPLLTPSSLTFRLLEAKRSAAGEARGCEGDGQMRHSSAAAVQCSGSSGLWCCAVRCNAVRRSICLLCSASKLLSRILHCACSTLQCILTGW